MIGEACIRDWLRHIDRELFGEIASGSSGSNHCHFRIAILPALPDLAFISASIQQASMPEPKLALEEAVLNAIGTVVRVVGTNHTPSRKPKPAAMRRIAAVFDYIDA